MKIQKIAATQLFDGYRFLGPDQVLILRDERVEEIVPKELAGEDIRFFNGIVCPGWINTHCHLELSFLKNKIPENCGMVDFILSVMANRNEAPELIENAISEAEHEMLQNGIAAVGDICNTSHTIKQKQKRKLNYTNFIEISGFVPVAAEKRFREGKKLQKTFLQSGLEAFLVPHAPYSVSIELLQLLYAVPNRISTIHYNESIAEKEFMFEGKGDFLRLYKVLGIDTGFFLQHLQSSKPLAVHTLHGNSTQILVHNVVTDLQDIKKIQNNFFTKQQTYFCICANANLFIGNGLPDISLLFQSGIPVCIGTDSLASNKELNIESEIKTIQKHFPDLSLETILQWATINGAKALGIAEEFGSFEKGKIGKFAVFNEQNKTGNHQV
jgi:cytosine/adenosine deaminase-related metal-dependent hydrolase